MSALLLGAVVAPLVAALLALFARQAAGWLVTGACLASLLALVLLSGASPALELAWLSSGAWELSLGLIVDGLSWGGAVVVAAVGVAVLSYSLGYARELERRATFFAWMGAFVGSMLALVLAKTLITLFFAWEAVGVASFALIGFHHREPRAVRAAQKAMLVTRIADLGLLAAMLLLAHDLGTTDLAAAREAAAAGTLGVSPVLLAGLLSIAALGKAAQLPWTAWLPDAMVGPTPVSALLHSATMVAAGPFLVLRLFPVFEAAGVVLELLVAIAAATALAAALVATAEGDLKRVLAWSTVSQLAEVFLALGLRDAAGAAYHLVAHAFFKAGLFLVAGILERRTGGRDLASLSGAARRLPLAGAAFSVCALGLVAVPPSAGYFSSALLISSARHAGLELGLGLTICLLAALTAAYAGRMTAILWRAPARSSVDARSPRIMLAAALALAVASLSAAALWILPLEGVLPPAVMPPPPGWQAAIVAASSIGAALGAARAWRRAEAATLGGWPRVLGRAFDELVRMPARAALGLSERLPPIEDALGRGAGALAAGVIAAARGAGLWEQVLHRGAGALTLATGSLASGVDRTEHLGFERGVDRGADKLLAGGRRLRKLEAGKIYLYAASLFGSVLAAGALLALALWLGGQEP